MCEKFTSWNILTLTLLLLDINIEKFVRLIVLKYSIVILVSGVCLQALYCNSQHHFVTETECDTMEYINLVQARILWQAVVDTGVNHGIM
jgi:hypothetical protein